MTRIISLIILLGVIICISNALICNNRIKSRPLISISMATTQIPTQSSNVGGVWSPESWKKFPIKQPPNYPDQVSYILDIVDNLIYYIINYHYNFIIIGKS